MLFKNVNSVNLNLSSPLSLPVAIISFLDLI
jgi:hypothetical protein